MNQQHSDVIIVGAGISGIVAAIELLDKNFSVLLIDRDLPKEIGGLAKWSFGGMFFVNSPVQRKAGIKDSVDLALTDWNNFAEFTPEETFTKQWAQKFVNECTDFVYRYLKSHGIGFFPVVHWVERGLFRPGNSVPRFHMVWGTGYELAKVFSAKLLEHPNKDRLQILYQHRVENILMEGAKIKGVSGTNEIDGSSFSYYADQIIIATGGINGSIEKVKQHWYKPWGNPPEVILNGSHPYAVGDLHDAANDICANVTHLDRMWNYAAGIHHPQPHMPGHGLSLVPPKSALWVNYQGKRFGPMPLMTAYDTRFLVEQICKEPIKYSWQILNLKIMNKEFAISGSESNDAIREKKLLGFIKTILLGNKKLVNRMIEECKDIVIAYSIDELVDKMNALAGTNHVDKHLIHSSIVAYDKQIARGLKFHNDEQLRRLAHVRQYRGDKVRTCKFQSIADPKAMPLIAIREFILSRKSLGGIQTDLQSRVMGKPDKHQKQQPIPGLYAVGEAAGFGGGGVHGFRALEGTFLSSCILTARTAAASIGGKLLGQS